MTPWQPRPRQCLRTGIRHLGCAAAVVDGQPVLYITGEQGGAGGRPVLVALTAHGEVLWREDMPSQVSTSRQASCVVGGPSLAAACSVCTAAGVPMTPRAQALP